MVAVRCHCEGFWLLTKKRLLTVVMYTRKSSPPTKPDLARWYVMPVLKHYFARINKKWGRQARKPGDSKRVLKIIVQPFPFPEAFGSSSSPMDV